MAKRPINIILFAIDSLWAAHMSAYGYHRLTTPHIDEFARSGVLFERTYSPHIPTTPAYASMLTGMDCFSTRCRRAPAQGAADGPGGHPGRDPAGGRLPIDVRRLQRQSQLPRV